MIYVALNSNYKYKSYELKTTIPMEMEVQATAVNGFAKGKITNNTDNVMENKYVKIDCYSKNNVLMGTKYVKIDKIEANEEKKFEVRFNFNKVEKAVVDIIEEQALTDTGVTEQERESDPEMGIAAMVAALILLYFM